MATKHFCDGCEAAIEGEPQVRGYVIKRDYCEACAEKVDAYQSEMDAIHNDLSERWVVQIRQLRKRYHKQVTLLPDELS